MVDKTQKVIGGNIVKFSKLYVFVGTHHLNAGFPLAYLLSGSTEKFCYIVLRKIAVFTQIF